MIPGLNVSTTNSGGALDGTMNINIRGTGTIGEGSGSSPLILIDGIEGNLNTVNPNDIESVSVLKDAASASIYGARASFGVILVTTKSGKSGKAKVSYSGNVRFNDAIAMPEMMDSYTFAQYFNRAASNSGRTPVLQTLSLNGLKVIKMVLLQLRLLMMETVGGVSGRQRTETLTGLPNFIKTGCRHMSIT